MNARFASADSRSGGLPLDGLLVLDFSQFLSGPSCALRLADLGATVVKVERPGSGDLCRQLRLSDLEVEGDSALFHTINRNKQSFAADLKNPDDLALVKRLIAHADVLVQNFRPGVMERLGLGYDAVRAINPRLVYGTITGYGAEGPWRGKPGQDLLVQSLSGLPWLSGDAEDGPVPVGVAVADILTGSHLAQGILACLVRRGVTGQGGCVDVSLLESTLDFQFQEITTFLNRAGEMPARGRLSSASVFLGAPYGVYRTEDGYIAIAMNPVGKLGQLIGCAALAPYADASTWFAQRDTIKDILRDHLKTRTTGHWLAILEPADIWCADVFTWPRLFAHDGFHALNMVQEVETESGTRLRTTRCPIRVDGAILTSGVAAPKVGRHTEAIMRQYRLAAKSK